MKYLSTALVIITLIVCGCVFALPAWEKAEERALAERELAIRERNVSVSLVFVSPGGEAPRHGLKLDPQKDASDEK